MEIKENELALSEKEAIAILRTLLFAQNAVLRGKQVSDCGGECSSLCQGTCTGYCEGECSGSCGGGCVGGAHSDL